MASLLDLKVESVNGVQEKTYSYNNRGQLESTTLNGVGTRVYDYDSRGNRTKATGPVTELDDRGESTYTWDAWDRLGSVVQDGQTLSSFSYDGTGLRYAKTTAEGTISYDCDNNGRVIAESTSEGVKAQNVWGNGILARKAEGAWYTYITNSHGDVIEVLDESGTAVNRYKYDEWGNATTSEESIENPIRYSGEYFDEETGLYYLRARYYDPSQARFISKDSYEGQLTNPESLNLYTYCENNPVMFVDPSGHVADTLIDAGFVVWDIVELTKDPTNVTNWAALGADAACVFIPFMTGGGRAVKFTAEIAKTVDVVKTAEKVKDGKRAVKGGLDDVATKKIPWGNWKDYEKVTVNGQEYAQVGDRLYSKHAVDRMQPSGNRYGHPITQAGGDYGRGVAPQYVEDVIASAKPVLQENGNLSYASGSLQVITNKQGAVVTIITK